MHHHEQVNIEEKHTPAGLAAPFNKAGHHLDSIEKNVTFCKHASPSLAIKEQPH